MRLIDAETLKHIVNGSKYYGTQEQRDFCDMITEAPTIDAVPVVRCKDCKYRDPEDKKCDCGHAIMWQLPREDDWFCADGEREDDE